MEKKRKKKKEEKVKKSLGGSDGRLWCPCPNTSRNWQQPQQQQAAYGPPKTHLISPQGN
jgi:hypothetical protein